MGILKKCFILSKTKSDKVVPTAKFEKMRANKLEIMVPAVLADRAFSRQPKNEKFNRQFK